MSTKTSLHQRPRPPHIFSLVLRLTSSWPGHGLTRSCPWFRLGYCAFDIINGQLYSKWIQGTKCDGFSRPGLRTSWSFGRRAARLPQISPWTPSTGRVIFPYPNKTTDCCCCCFFFNIANALKKTKQASVQETRGQNDFLQQWFD